VGVHDDVRFARLDDTTSNVFRLSGQHGIPGRASVYRAYRASSVERANVPIQPDGVCHCRQVRLPVAKRPGRRKTMASDQVPIRFAWNGWQKAEVRVDCLEDIHWLQPAGAPRCLIHAYIWCTHIVGRDIPHHCGDTDGPHRLLICVIKHDVSSITYEELSRRATGLAPLSIACAERERIPSA